MKSLNPRLLGLCAASLSAAGFSVSPLTAAPRSDAASAPKTDKNRPNVVFILADDMGYGDISALYPQSKWQTPRLDALARESVVFTEAHSGSSVSTPTRYGLLTGCYSWRSSLKEGVLGGFSPALITPDRPTLGTLFQKHGYHTAAIGKWHLGWHWDNIEEGQAAVNFAGPVTDGPTSRGFDYFYGISASLDMSPYVYVENDRVTALPNRETEDKSHLGWWRKGPTGADFVHQEVLPNLIQRACHYIHDRAAADRPFFLYLPLTAPHTPALPSPEFLGKSGINEYADFVLMLDHLVGRVLDALREAGVERNTLVVFATDNGCAPAADTPALEAAGHFASAGRRGYKADLFDGGHRVPCMVRWPQRFKPHEVHQPICLTDFYATFAALLGYSPQEKEAEDSYNLLPLLQRKKEPAPLREATVHHSVYGLFALRQGPWKLLLTPSSGGWSEPRHGPKNKVLETLPPVQLYNMELDPAETRNLCDQYPQKVEELKALMDKYLREGRSAPRLNPSAPNK